MKYVCFAALALLALRDVPALWQGGKRREVLLWAVLAALAAGLMWLQFWSGAEWFLADAILGG